MDQRPSKHNDPAGPGVPNDIEVLIVRYFDNDLGDTGLAELRDALTIRPDARDLFVRMQLQGQMLTESLSANYKEQDQAFMQGSPSVLAELAKLEQQAHASLVELHHIKQPWHRRPWLAGAAGLAAVIVLGVVLSFVFHDPAATPDAPNTATKNESTTNESTPAQPIVATLTNTHHAQWTGRPASAGTDTGTEHPPKTGTPLHPNQRLTLTAGFAEITTARGAVAILQAPATIELLDNDNALRLVTGKLVGICETDSSKGFLVRTEHLDITDLGTRFVIDDVHERQTTVQVVDGLVELMARDGDQTGITLSGGQAARLDDASLAIERIAFDRDLAPTDWPQLIRTPRLAGDIAPAPDDVQSLKLDATERAQQILLLAEQAGVRLSQDLPLVASDRSRFDSTYQSPTRHIEAGTVVDSFLLHLDPIGSSLDQEITRCVATVAFHRPILGVIVSGELISASDELLGKPNIEYAPFFSSTRDARGLESEDRISLSSDRKTLSVDLSVGYGIDQLRVLVQPLPGSGPGD